MQNKQKESNVSKVINAGTIDNKQQNNLSEDQDLDFRAISIKYGKDNEYNTSEPAKQADSEVFFSTNTKSKKYKIAKSYRNLEEETIEKNKLSKWKKESKKDKDILTEHQKAKLDYILMEEESKIAGLQKNLDTSKKLLYLELEKENYNLTTIKNLKEEITKTSSDIETIKFETECKIRGLLSLEQYSKLEKKIQKRRYINK